MMFFIAVSLLYWLWVVCVAIAEGGFPSILFSILSAAIDREKH
jgi:hypothetical protein